MKWTNERQPNEEIRYNHVISETPLGKVSIEWKGWKERPSYDVDFEWKHIGIYGSISLKEAKDKAENHMKEITQELIDFQKNNIINNAEFKNELKKAIESGIWIDYVYDGIDEIPHKEFESEISLKNVLEVIRKNFK